MNTVLLGPSHCGKTTLAKRIVDPKFEFSSRYEPTFGVDLLPKKDEAGKKIFTLEDIGEPARYQAVIERRLRQSKAILACINAREFDTDIAELGELLKQFKNSFTAEMHLIFVVTQCDTDLLIDKKEAQTKLECLAIDLAEHLTISFQKDIYFTSAKDNLGISELSDKIESINKPPVHSSEPPKKPSPSVSNNLLLRILAHPFVEKKGALAIFVGVLMLFAGTASLALSMSIIGVGAACCFANFFAKKSLRSQANNIDEPNPLRQDP